MTVTKDDFEKIWASTSPLTPYSFSDANYKEGWNFVGATPPSRQMWDFLQKNNDEKMQYLADNYLPLSGGTMTGAIRNNWNYGAIIKNSDPNSSGGIVISGGYEDENGGQIVLVGEGNNNNPGNVIIRPRNSNGFKELMVKPDGTLTWDGKNVERVNAIGNGYIRYESGLQICFGVTPDINQSTTTVTVTLPVAFVDVNYRVSLGRRWVIVANEDYYFNGSRTTTSFEVSAIGTIGSNNHAYDYIAIGRWK